MKKNLRISLQTSEEQKARLLALQQLFARACNALAPTVRDSRCWNRVALHHMTYKGLREQFPTLGSQMACNAIYSVCRASRAVYQGVESPFNLACLGDRPLPLIRFADNCPVYFDRHTLSLKSGQLSLFTLDGRMRFQLALRPEDEAAFQQGRLREIVLLQRADGEFELSFLLESVAAGEAAQRAPHNEEWPRYLMVEEQVA
ncbi:hypothetical protein [Malikia sp.]|uniref:hypothetical protein n=1 Tax=Malikia sp. TaxID=2070706 RepID=UPI00262B771B|nr:hypothetical protein [Malikia sp.]MDD2729235.1 hypothetical protein [Malikia sp.]